MKESLARDYLDRGLSSLREQEPEWDRRQKYLEGDQDLPYAPPGINAEYQALREMAVANYIQIAIGAPIQRMGAEGFHSHRSEDADLEAWREIWQPNKLDARQRIVYTQMFCHGRGLMSVSPNPANRKSPKIRPENAKRVWLEPNPEDPFEALFAVKLLKQRKVDAASQLILPAGVQLPSNTVDVAYVYTATEWCRFVSRNTGGFVQKWELEDQGGHRLGGIPFVPFDFNVDADGKPHPSITKLMPQQDAINTIRFNTLLAMQFSAYRQRVFTGYDPVVRDQNGNPLLQRDADGKPLVDKNGHPIPVVNSPGRVGVDRALVFPGADTKVFDLPESNLDNYIKVLQQFLTDFFATGQIPPQYALTKMANLTGDGMAGAESTFQSLMTDIKTAAAEGLQGVWRLANRARGEREDDYSAEVIWADTEVRSFAQIVDAIQKLIASGMSRHDAWTFLPAATPPKVSSWVKNSDTERERADRALQELNDKMSFDNG